MKVDNIPELSLEEVQKMFEDYNEPTQALLGIINELVRSYNLVTNKRISLTDNVDCDVKTITVVGGSTVRIGLGGRSLPRQILVGRVRTTGAAPTSAVQVLDWTTSGREIIINSIVGLTASQSYDITLTIYY
jgi:hypothetical protein